MCGPPSVVRTYSFMTDFGADSMLTTTNILGSWASLYLVHDSYALIRLYIHA